MKMLVITLLSSLICVHAQGNAVPGAPGVVDQQQVVTNALEQIAQSDPEVKQKLAGCYTSNPDTVSDCLWKGLSAEKKDQIRRAIEEFQKESKGVTTGVNLRKHTQQKGSVTDDALSKLESFYSSRLEEELGTKDNSFTTNDQQVYFELAKVQIGKNIMSAWSAFCLDAGYADGKIIVPKDDSKRNKIREENIKGLSNASEATETHYKSCIGHLAILCHEQKGKVAALEQTLNYKDYVKTTPSKKSVQSIHRTVVDNDMSLAVEDYKNTKTRACETLAYTQSLKNQLAATEKVADSFDNSMKDKKWAGVALEQNNITDRKAVDFDRATTITSGDLKDGYYDTIAAGKERLEACLAGDITNEECKKLLVDAQDAEELKQSGAALMLETEVMKEKIDTALKANDLEAQKQIVQSLRPDLAANELDPTRLKNEFDRIREQYSDERIELIASLSKKVKELQVGDTPNETEERVKSHAGKILSRGNEYVQLMHFNNIVTGFLQIKKNNGDTVKNSRVIDLELSNLAKIDSTANDRGYIQGTFSEQENQVLSDGIRQNNKIETKPSNTSEIIRLQAKDVSSFNDYVIE